MCCTTGDALLEKDFGHPARECAIVLVEDGQNRRLSQPFDTTPYDAEAPAASRVRPV